MNIDEDGTVKLSTIQPGVGQEITATLTDPDMRRHRHEVAVVEVPKPTWSASFADAIDGATSASYTPAPRVEDNPATLGINEEDNGDEGMFLQCHGDLQGRPVNDVEGTEE